MFYWETKSANFMVTLLSILLNEFEDSGHNKISICANSIFSFPTKKFQPDTRKKKKTVDCYAMQQPRAQALQPTAWVHILVLPFPSRSWYTVSLWWMLANHLSGHFAHSLPSLSLTLCWSLHYLQSLINLWLKLKKKKINIFPLWEGRESENFALSSHSHYFFF